MDCITKYQPKRDLYWPEVEQYFSALPPLLYQQGKLLQTHLAARYSDTGQFRDIFCRSDDYPLLYLHLWLLDDFDFPNGEDREQIEKHLFLAMLFSFAAIYTHENILDEASFLDNDYLFLAQTLTQQATFHFAQLFANTLPFWDYYHMFWNAYTEAVLWGLQAPVKRAVLPGEEDLPPTGEKLAPMKIIAAAVAIKAGREASLPQLFSLMDGLNHIFQTRWDISTIQRDLMRGNYTYPIVRTMMESPLPLQQPFVPEQVMGAILLTNSIEQICQECLNHLEDCRAVAGEIGLPTFEAYFVNVEEMIHEVLTLFSLSVKPAASKRVGIKKKKPNKPFFMPYLDTLSKVIEMAEGYLLSDLTFRESWEVHRRGLFNTPEVIAKFPAGLIIEILCLHGNNLSKQVDEFYQNLSDTQFSYYDHPDFPYPDTDNLGVLLRLYRYSVAKDSHRHILETPLHWMVDNIRESGQIPVWLTKHITSDIEEKPPILLFGDNCGTIEANLLLGLIDYAWTDYRAIIMKSAINLLDRFIDNGLGITVNYPPLYTLGIVLKLILKLSEQPVQEALRNRIEKAFEVLIKDLEAATKRRRVTPQDAALLMLACLNPVAGHLLNPRWVTILFKNQRFDGSWYGEPFFFAPNRGEVTTWYSSHLLTTAFCYHALKTYEQYLT